MFSAISTVHWFDRAMVRPCDGSTGSCSSIVRPFCHDHPTGLEITGVILIEPVGHAETPGDFVTRTSHFSHVFHAFLPVSDPLLSRWRSRDVAFASPANPVK